MVAKLMTRDGGFVVAAPLPPFDEPPEVVLWGERVFVARPALSVADPVGDRVYVEVFSYHLIPVRTA